MGLFGLGDHIYHSGAEEEQREEREEEQEIGGGSSSASVEVNAGWSQQSQVAPIISKFFSVPSVSQGPPKLPQGHQPLVLIV